MRESKPKSSSRSSEALPSPSARRSDQIRQRHAAVSTAAVPGAATDKARQPTVDGSSNRSRTVQRKKSHSGALARNGVLNRTDASHRSAARSGPPAPPPVMARGAVSSSQSYGVRGREQSKRVQRARRTYNIAVGSQGAEMRLPAMPRIHIGWRLASFLVAGLLIFGLYQLWNAPLYRVNEDALQIHGLQRLNEDAVRTVLAAENKPVFTLDTQQMQQNLLDAFPEFSTAEVSIELPSTIVVTVTERVPVLIWHQDGRTSLIDTNGMLFPLRDESVQTNFPVVEAASSPPAPIFLPSGDEQGSEGDTLDKQEKEERSGDFLNIGSSAALSGASVESARPFMFPEMVSAVLSLAAKAPEGAVLIYDALHGLGWKDHRGWEVYFGDVLETTNGDIEMKLHVYKSILEYLKAQDTKPALISVEFVHSPYYRLAGESGD